MGIVRSNPTTRLAVCSISVSLRFRSSAETRGQDTVSQRRSSPILCSIEFSLFVESIFSVWLLESPRDAKTCLTDERSPLCYADICLNLNHDSCSSSFQLRHACTLLGDSFFVRDR